MTLQDRQLLLQDLCARLPYGVKAQVSGWDEEKGEVEVPLRIYSINTDGYVYFEINDYDVNYIPIEDVRYYLRPMSSMTEEEKNQWLWITNEGITEGMIDRCVDWLNKKMFDWRGLIEKGLALESPEGMY